MIVRVDQLIVVGVNTVTAYDENGWKEELPTLNQGRFHHGCNSFVNQNNELVSHHI